MRLFVPMLAALLVSVTFACARSPEEELTAFTPVPQFEDTFGRLISCEDGRAYRSDEVLIAVSNGRIAAVERRIESAGFSVRLKEEAPTETTWITVGVPGGWVPAALSAMARWDGVLEAMPNFVLYAGDVLVDDPAECQGEPPP